MKFNLDVHQIYIWNTFDLKDEGYGISSVTAKQKHTCYSKTIAYVL